MLVSLLQIYEDDRASGREAHKNEGEILAYHLLSHPNDTAVETKMDALPVDVLENPYMVMARAIHQAYREARELHTRSPTDVASALAVAKRIFICLRKVEVPFLLCCAVEPYFADIRKSAFRALHVVSSTDQTQVTVAMLQTLLSYDRAEHVIDDLKANDVEVLDGVVRFGKVDKNASLWQLGSTNVFRQSYFVNERKGKLTQKDIVTGKWDESRLKEVADETKRRLARTTEIDESAQTETKCFLTTPQTPTPPNFAFGDTPFSFSHLQATTAGTQNAVSLFSSVSSKTNETFSPSSKLCTKPNPAITLPSALPSLPAISPTEYTYNNRAAGPPSSLFPPPQMLASPLTDDTRSIIIQAVPQSAVPRGSSLESLRSSPPLSPTAKRPRTASAMALAEKLPQRAPQDTSHPVPHQTPTFCTRLKHLAPSNVTHVADCIKTTTDPSLALWQLKSSSPVGAPADRAGAAVPADFALPTVPPSPPSPEPTEFNVVPGTVFGVSSGPSARNENERSLELWTDLRASLFATGGLGSLDTPRRSWAAERPAVSLVPSGFKSSIRHEAEQEQKSIMIAPTNFSKSQKKSKRQRRADGVAGDGQSPRNTWTDTDGHSPKQYALRPSTRKKPRMEQTEARAMTTAFDEKDQKHLTSDAERPPATLYENVWEILAWAARYAEEKTGGLPDQFPFDKVRDYVVRKRLEKTQ